MGACYLRQSKVYIVHFEIIGPAITPLFSFHRFVQQCNRLDILLGITELPEDIDRCA